MKSAALIVVLVAAQTASAEDFDYLGRWHVSRGIVAPWVAEDAPQPDAIALVGKDLVFSADRADGPGLLACANARYERDQRPLEGLFQGNLPAPVENGAGSVGLVKAPVPSLSLTCDTGIFDMHFATRDALLLGLDNVVWVLDRSPGAVAAAGTPEHTVQALLQDHYTHGLEFTQERTLAQRAWLSDALAEKTATYFSQEFPEGDAPPINGDPFTDSQDYPPIFSVREAKIDGATAIVPVRFDSGYESRTLRYELRKQANGWRVDDIDYDHGTPFTEMLLLTP